MERNPVMNETNSYKTRRTPNTSEPDDGWWQSLMSEEFKYAPAAKPRPERKPARKPAAPKERRAPGMDWVDWTRVLEIQEAESVCYAEVVGFNRGGLLVRTQEFQGFVPRSHLAAAVNGQRITERLLEGYLGREIELKVIECDPERGRIVLSERAAQTAPGSRQTLLQTLQIDQELDGVVTNVTPFGLFIDQIG